MYHTNFISSDLYYNNSVFTIVRSADIIKVYSADRFLAGRRLNHFTFLQPETFQSELWLYNLHFVHFRSLDMIMVFKT